MSTKVISNYTLCSRTWAVQLVTRIGGESPLLSPVMTHPGDRSLSDSEVYNRVAGTGRCTYRDVARSGVTAANQREIRDQDVSRDIFVQPKPLALAEEELSRLSMPTSLDNDDDERPWTVVSKGKGRKAKCSPVSIASKSDVEVNKKPTKILDPVIVAAEQQLTADEQDRIQNRYKKVNSKSEAKRPEESEISKGEGPSKGKGVDPGNWGDIEFAPEEVDVAVQEAALASYKVAKELENNTATE